jgi:hypothetical protein
MAGRQDGLTLTVGVEGMTDLSKIVYKASKGELRIDELTDDATALARFELSTEEKLALRRTLDSSDTASLSISAIGGWY